MVDPFRRSKSDFEAKMASGEYGHVFMDEYWIGSKPVEHKVILKVIKKIKGYVWISSVFDYREDLLEDEKKKLKECTKPLIVAMKEAGGHVSRITRVFRGTGNIIDLEKSYSELYQKRSYPYGTKEILGDFDKGYPVTWLVEHLVGNMYTRCGEIVESATTDILSLDANHKEELRFTPDDILVVNFAVRTEESFKLKDSLEECLRIRNVPFWTVENPGERDGKVTLLQALTRKDSTYLDGIESPMVIVILPSGLLLNTTQIANQREQKSLEIMIHTFLSFVHKKN